MSVQELLTLSSETDGDVRELLLEAATLCQAAESKVPEDIDRLASSLRSFVPAMSYEDSLSEASEILARYSDSEVTEADFPVGYRRQRVAPDPKLNDQYAPGKAEWWQP